MWFVRGLLVALLPAPERNRVQHGDVSAARWSVALGAVQGFAGILLYVVGALDYMTGSIGYLNQALLESRMSLTETDIRGGGLVSWFSWHLEPEAWLYIYLTFTGFVRAVGYFAAGVPIAEPVVVVAVRSIQALKRQAERGRVRSRLGPIREDRAVLEDGCDLVLLAGRPKDDWDEDTTVKVGDRFYRILDVEERADGRHRTMAYRLGELDEHDAVRGLVSTSARLPTNIPDPIVRPGPDQLFYFAYSRLMADDEMWGVAPSARLIGVARCPRHRLWLHRPRGDGNGVPTAVAGTNPSDAVWGVVWDCAPGDAAALDAAERIGQQCRWESIEVKGNDGNTYLARVCVSDTADLDLSLVPAAKCLERVLTVGRALGFPQTYLAPIAGARR